MKNREKNFLNVLLVTLPLLSYFVREGEIFLAVALTLCSFWTAILLFHYASAWLSSRLMSIAIILWVAASAGIGQYFFQISPVWAGSAWLLISEKKIRRKRRNTQSRLWMTKQFRKGYGFAGLALYLSVCQIVLGQAIGIGWFQNPSGMFFLLAGAAIFWLHSSAEPQKGGAR